MSRNQRLLLFSSAIVPMFLLLFFPWSDNAYKVFFGIDMNIFESIAALNQLLSPFIVRFVIPLPVLMSILGSFNTARILSKLM